MKRRKALKNLGLATLGSTAIVNSVSCQTPDTKKKETMETKGLKGNINHSVCRWCYGGSKLEDMAIKTKEIGLKSIELLTPEEWPVVQKLGLTCAVGTEKFADISNGFNEPKNHDALINPYLELIVKAADAGIPNVIVFSGNRREMSDEVGMENCAKGLDKIVKQAEKYNVTVIMELLNSKKDHKDYMCDHTPWGVELCKKIGSPRFRLLYDIYHMQIMEGDIIQNIRDHHEYIAHYHTGGVPGRNEIDDSQELYYPAIMQAILDTGYKGYVAQEFIPKRDDKFASLKQGVEICDV